MAKMRDMINSVLTELRFGSGADVQIHLQDGIAVNISRLYRFLMKKYQFRDYLITTALSTAAADGQVETSLTGILTKFSNIVAVYLSNESEPLQVGMASGNPNLLRRPTIVASGGAKVFTIWPRADRDIILISKVYTEDDFGLDDDVPFYSDILVLGAAYMLSIKAGTNPQLTQDLQRQYAQFLDLYVMDEMQDSYPLNKRSGGIPLEWYDNGA